MKKLQQENVHNVSKRQWKKWPDIAQRVFNDTFADMNANQSLMLHPKTKKVAAEQWSTTAWNAAWTAADAVVQALKDIADGKGYAK